MTDFVFDLAALERFVRAAIDGKYPPAVDYAEAIVDAHGRTTVSIEPKALLKLIQSARIAHDLAEQDPRRTYRHRDKNLDRACAFCGAMPDAEHALECLHRRAVEATTLTTI